MDTTLIHTLCHTKEKLYDQLVDANVQDLEDLQTIARTLSIQRSPLTSEFLRYLIEKIPEKRLLDKLLCMNTMDNLADEMQHIIFVYCLEVRDSRQDLFDAQAHYLLYAILSKYKISANVWEQDLSRLNETKNTKILALYDGIIENYIYNPEEYPETVILDKDVLTTASARFALFNVLYGSDRRPIQCSNDVQFAYETSTLLQEMNTLKVEFVVETQWIENALKDPNELNTCCFDTKLPACSVLNRETIDTAVRECCNLLIHVPRFVDITTFSLIHLLSSIKQTANDQYDHFMQMCRAAWLKILASLLNDVVFSNPDHLPLKDSVGVALLIRCCACSLQFDHYTRHHTQNDFQHHLEAIWSHFEKTRTIYLNSTQTTDKDLFWLKTIVMTTARSSL